MLTHRHRLSTICTRPGLPDEAGGLQAPLRRSTAYKFTEASLQQFVSGTARDVWLYSRYGNPTVRSLELKLAQMEDAEDAIATASGMAAISSVLFSQVKPGDRWLISRELYGNTYSLLQNDIRRFGIVLDDFDPSDPASLEAAIGAGKPPSLVYCETISNPLARAAALPEILALSNRYECVSVVDNTFASPWNALPTRLGATFTVESGTKFLNGHSDVICGVVAGKQSDITAVWQQMTRMGGCIDPQAAALFDRGISSFPLRMPAIQQTAEAVALWLASHPKIEQVYYPGVSEALPAWLPGGGGVIAFRVAGGEARALQVVQKVRIIIAATSLGGLESLISLPMNTSHKQFSPEQREALGILPGTVRLSVGSEPLSELQLDLDQALCGDL